MLGKTLPLAFCNVIPSTYLGKMSVSLPVLLTAAQLKRKTFPAIRKKPDHTLRVEVFQRYTENEAKEDTLK